MYRSISVILTLFLFIATVKAGDGTTFGKEITEKQTTKISEILDTPENFDDKVVKIEGTVVNVCETRSCWIEIASDKEYQTIKVKVKDGEIIFPMEAKGKPAVVQGEVYSFVPAVQSDCSDNCGDKEKHAQTCR